ncbi:hypothetical protein AcW1_000380 [Taiwanofungus camphoratus]|nr:hypothetical protein AcW2_001123 [Antrodia cinnamomea]KAI0936036.1 hypothetical protein AcV5_004282 [Antrodia cinnamomea]KAI0961245.1 hypothetical protein AcV7_000400 [Antrodia cinnamomea]KAI0963250.1 hypothetical protein AcW1_000380 [Antrodia cinnamomea]
MPDSGSMLRLYLCTLRPYPNKGFHWVFILGPSIDIATDDRICTQYHVIGDLSKKNPRRFKQEFVSSLNTKPMIARMFIGFVNPSHIDVVGQLLADPRPIEDGLGSWRWAHIALTALSSSQILKADRKIEVYHALRLMYDFSKRVKDGGFQTSEEDLPPTINYPGL